MRFLLLWKQSGENGPHRVSSRPRRESVVTSTLFAPRFIIYSFSLFRYRRSCCSRYAPRTPALRADAIKSSSETGANTHRCTRSYKLIQITPRHYPLAIWNCTRNRIGRGAIRFVSCAVTRIIVSRICVSYASSHLAFLWLFRISSVKTQLFISLNKKFNKSATMFLLM